VRPSTAATRERIRLAALEVFSERGFDGAATRDIAQRAGCTQPLINYHFASKEALWRSSVDLVFERLDGALAGEARPLEGQDAAGRARELVRQFVRFSARNPQLHRIITQECKVESPRMDWLVERHVRPYFETAAALFAALAEAGVVVPAVPPAHLYYLLTGAAATMFVLGPECRRLTGLDPAADDVIEAHADAVCLLLLGPPPSPPVPE